MTAEFNYDFNRLFVENKGGPITYKGQSLVLSDKVTASFGEIFTVTIESTQSRFPQGVGISEGVEVFGQRTKKAVVWEYFSVPPQDRIRVRSRLPFSFEVICRNKQGFLHFYNMAEVEGRARWEYAAAMIVDDIPTGRRYRCNDWQPNDDFHDVIFRVERLKQPFAGSRI
jgi:hypothetical protein